MKSSKVRATCPGGSEVPDWETRLSNAHQSGLAAGRRLAENQSFGFQTGIHWHGYKTRVWAVAVGADVTLHKAWGSASAFVMGANGTFVIGTTCHKFASLAEAHEWEEGFRNSVIA